MNKQQLQSRHVTDAAGALTQSGCRILAAHAHGQQPVVCIITAIEAEESQ